MTGANPLSNNIYLQKQKEKESIAKELFSAKNVASIDNNSAVFNDSFLNKMENVEMD